MQKRWIAMGAATIACAAILALNTSGEVSTTVSGITLHPQRVEQTVSCVGVVEAADGLPIVLPIGCHIDRVKVKVGQRVKKGTCIATVDRQATIDAIEDPSETLLLAALDEEIIAPEDGVVVAVSAKSGKKLDRGTPCAIIARESDIQVRIGIREKDLKQLKTGMAVHIKGEGFSKEDYSGKLAEISSAARSDTEGGTVVEGVVTLDSGQVDNSLRLGLTAKALVVTTVNEKGLIIPYGAIATDEQGDYVYVAEQGRVKVRRIGDSIRVGSGVLVGDEAWDGMLVITETDEVTVGMKVSVTEASQ